MNMKENITLFLEKNVPTNPSKWQYYVSQAKKKFDVYPSAYANGWAAKQYKAAGGGWKTEGEEPQHVAQGLPQTKELKGKLIGEKLITYFNEIGLKHALYQNENGDIKVIGLNKEQVKEAINKVVEGYKNLKESEQGDKIQNLNNRIKALQSKLSATKSPEQKKLFQDRLKNALQTLSNYKKGYGIKAPHTEGLPGGIGTGLSLPNGYINGAPSEDDVNKMKDKLGRNEANDKEGSILDTLKNIVDSHSAAKVKDQKTGQTMLVDVQTANAILHIYNGLSNVNKENMLKMGLKKMAEVSYKILSKYK